LSKCSCATICDLLLREFTSFSSLEQILKHYDMAGYQGYN
jgi:hypothetical protein